METKREQAENWIACYRRRRAELIDECSSRQARITEIDVSIANWLDRLLDMGREEAASPVVGMTRDEIHAALVAEKANESDNE